MATFLSVSSCTSPKAGGAGLYFFPSRKVEELVKGKKVHKKKRLKNYQKKVVDISYSVITNYLSRVGPKGVRINLHPSPLSLTIFRYVAVVTKRDHCVIFCLV